MELTNERLIQIVKAAIYELEWSEYEHGVILEYLGISEKEYNYFKTEEVS